MFIYSIYGLHDGCLKTFVCLFLLYTYNTAIKSNDCFLYFFDVQVLMSLPSFLTHWKLKSVTYSAACHPSCIYRCALSMRLLLAKCILLGRFSLRYGLSGWSEVLHFRTDTEEENQHAADGENEIVWQEAKQADNLSFFLSIQKVTFGILRIPTSSSPGPHSRLRRETQDHVSRTGYKLNKLTLTDRRVFSTGNSQEKKLSGRLVGLMRAAGPWMTEKPSVLST